MEIAVKKMSELFQKGGIGGFIINLYPPSLAHLFVVKKMFASLHFLSLQKMCLRLLSFTDTFASLLLPLENILRCARTCLLRKNASIFIVVNCALTSIFQSRSSHGSSRVLFIFLEDYNDKIIKNLLTF